MATWIGLKMFAKLCEVRTCGFDVLIVSYEKNSARLTHIFAPTRAGQQIHYVTEQPFWLSVFIFKNIFNSTESINIFKLNSSTFNFTQTRVNTGSNFGGTFTYKR